MEEIWKDIEGFEGRYQISNLGQVRSIDRVVGITHFKGRILKQRISNTGYLRACMPVGKKKVKAFSCHRLVAKAFIPNSGNRLNNKLDNLEWCTSRENTKHAVTTGLFSSGQDNHLSKYKNEDILEVVKYLHSGLNPSQVSRKVKISRPVCSKINNGKCWVFFLISIGVKTFPISKSKNKNISGIDE